MFGKVVRCSSRLSGEGGLVRGRLTILPSVCRLKGVDFAATWDGGGGINFWGDDGGDFLFFYPIWSQVFGLVM